MITKNIGMLLLAIYLIAVGILAAHDRRSGREKYSGRVLSRRSRETSSGAMLARNIITG